MMKQNRIETKQKKGGVEEWWVVVGEERRNTSANQSKVNHRPAKKAKGSGGDQTKRGRRA